LLARKSRLTPMAIQTTPKMNVMILLDLVCQLRRMSLGSGGGDFQQRTRGGKS